MLLQHGNLTLLQTMAFYPCLPDLCVFETQKRFAFFFFFSFVLIQKNRKKKEKREKKN